MKEDAALFHLVDSTLLNQGQRQQLQEAGFYNPATDMYAWVPDNALRELTPAELQEIREALQVKPPEHPTKGGVLAGLCKSCGLPRELCTCNVEEDEDDTPKTTTEDEDLDRLVTSASTPSLASLFKKGIKAGVLKAQVHYSN